jgi:NADPH:quinone reductase-like Zn-dependent oxidoreductase
MRLAAPAGANEEYAVKAIVQHGYGPPGVLELRDIGTSAARDREVLVRVRAAAVNPADWHGIGEYCRSSGP